MDWQLLAGVYDLYLCICVFVYLCICVFVYLCNVIGGSGKTGGGFLLCFKCFCFQSNRGKHISGIQTCQNCFSS